MTDVTYYRQILHDQTEFLNSKIEKYLKILDDELDQLPESVVGQIRLVIGQSRLFINERFKQFSGLVDDCEQRRGEKEIKLEDLAGFWDMISYQIDDLKSKYSELEQLQSNEWKLTQSLQTTVINGSATNGFANKMNGNRHLDNNHQQNGKDTIDGDKKPVMTKKVPARSNFREFLKAKKQEKHVKNDTKLNNGNDSKINGHHENGDTTTTTSTNGHHNNDNDDNDIQIMILVNNNNNNNNHNVKHNGGHQPTTKDVKSDNDCSETSKNNDDDCDNNEPNTHQNDDDGESNKKKSSIQVPVN